LTTDGRTGRSGPTFQVYDPSRRQPDSRYCLTIAARAVASPQWTTLACTLVRTEQQQARLSQHQTAASWIRPGKDRIGPRIRVCVTDELR